MTVARERMTVDIEPRTLAAAAAAFIGLVALLGFVNNAPRTVTALAVASIISIALDPAVTRLAQRLGSRRGAAVAVLALAAAIVASIAAALIAPPTYQQAKQLRRDVPHVVQSMTKLPVVGGKLRDSGFPAKARRWIEDLPKQLSGDTSPLRSAATTAFRGATAGILVLLLTAALLIDGPYLVDQVRRALPVASRDAATRAAVATRDVVGRYVAGSLTVAGFAGVFTLVSGLVLRVPLAPLLAVWVAMWDLVPQIGGLAGGAPFVLLGFTRSPLTGVLCLLLFFVYQQLKHNVVEPVLVGRAIRLSAPATMAAALIGVSAGGVVGALLAVPLTGAAKAIYLERRGLAAAAATDARPARTRRRTKRES